jgi:truncated hemoglobin YjbI
MPCPFEAKLGFSTKETRQEYLDLIAEKKKMDDDQAGPSEETIESLTADLDTTKPLYYWQLYSILGKDPIIDCVTTFYSLIWADDDTDAGAGFKAAFANVCEIDMHVKAQSAYWIDSFGGGRVYWGGHSRLGFHHYSRYAEPVMNAAGATRWMKHMRHALSSYDFATNGYTDPRVIPCLVDFLHAKMRTYALDFGWELDESDFDYEGFRYPPKFDGQDGTVSEKQTEANAIQIENVRSYLDKFQSHSA